MERDVIEVEKEGCRGRAWAMGGNAKAYGGAWRAYVAILLQPCLSKSGHVAVRRRSPKVPTTPNQMTMFLSMTDNVLTFSSQAPATA